MPISQFTPPGTKITPKNPPKCFIEDGIVEGKIFILEKIEPHLVAAFIGIPHFGAKLQGYDWFYNITFFEYVEAPPVFQEILSQVSQSLSLVSK